MSTETRPSEHAIIAHVADAETAEALVAQLREEAGVDGGSVTTGTGAEFAAELEAGDPDSKPASRVVKWLLSLGQEREELVRLGQHAREGRHAVVVNDVTTQEDLDAVAGVLKAHGARDIRYFGDWQVEDLDFS